MIEIGTLPTHKRDILVGPRIGETRDEAEPRFTHAWTHTVDEGLLPEVGVNRLVMHDLLHLVQKTFALLGIELGGLLLEELVKFGVAAIDIDAALGDEGLHSRGSIAEGAARSLYQIFEALLAIPLEERGALQRPKLSLDAHLREAVEDGFGKVGVGDIAIIFAGIEAVREAGLGQKFLRLCRIIDRYRRLPVVVESLWHDAAGDVGEAERQRLTDALVVDRQDRCLSHTHVVPG